VNMADMPKIVRLDPDYSGHEDQVIGWAGENAPDTWPQYVRVPEVPQGILSKGDTPERIWAWKDKAWRETSWNDHGDKRYTPDDATEYVRADLAAPEWQDIKTAPKDGTDILACAKNWDGCSVVSWGGSRFVGMCDGELSIESQTDFSTTLHEPYITHWMPLPKPPTPDT
jgi:hypothetical protein